MFIVLVTYCNRGDQKAGFILSYHRWCAMAIVWSQSSLKQHSLTGEGDQWYLKGITIKITFVLLHQIDLALTMLAVSLGLSELNPVMTNLLDQPLLLILTKLAFPLLIVRFVPYKLLIPATLFLFLALGWNARQLILLLL